MFRKYYWSNKGLNSAIRDGIRRTLVQKNAKSIPVDVKIRQKIKASPMVNSCHF